MRVSRQNARSTRHAAKGAYTLATVNHLPLGRSLALFARAQQRIPSGSQTNSKRPSQFAFGGYPIYAERGQGGRIIDVDGNEYIDLVQALGPVILGYCYPAVDAAIAAQMARGIIYGLMSPLEVECAELIGEIVPCAEMVRFFKGGRSDRGRGAGCARLHQAPDDPELWLPQLDRCLVGAQW